MDVLKKIKSATLIEAIVATVIIVIIFIIAGLVLNSLILNNFFFKTHNVRNRIYEIQYLINNKIVIVPYQEEFENWDIKFNKETKENQIWIIVEANNKETKKTILHTSLYE